jgi:hypothetical protein
MRQTRCPYTTLPLAEIEDTNGEHIVPSALGVPESFTVRASATSNTLMNRLIDEPFLDQRLVKFFAAKVGAESRSGPVSAILEGILVDGAIPIRAKFSKTGMVPSFVTPVDKDEKGNVSAVRGFGKEAVEHAEQMKKKASRRKSVSMSIGPVVSAENPLLRFAASLDLKLVIPELVKIAYLMTVRVFGDEAVVSPSGAMYREALTLQSIEAVGATGIGGRLLYEFPSDLRAARPNEHALTCFFTSDRIVSAVSLFGIFQAVLVTPARGMPKEEDDGEVVVVDASQRKYASCRFRDFKSGAVTI